MKNKPLIIGICGHAQSGKDTIADYLVEKYDYNKLPFAKSLKEMVDRLFSLEEGVEKSEYLSQWGMTKRELLQIVGTKMREVHPDIWVHRVKTTIICEHIFKNINHFVIPDVRYKNEIEMIKEYGGKLIKIIRKDYKSSLSVEEQDHPSETSLDNIPDSDFDWVITAKSGEIGKIHIEVDSFMEEMNPLYVIPADTHNDLTSEQKRVVDKFIHREEY